MSGVVKTEARHEQSRSEGLNGDIGIVVHKT